MRQLGATHRSHKAYHALCWLAPRVINTFTRHHYRWRFFIRESGEIRTPTSPDSYSGAVSSLATLPSVCFHAHLYDAFGTTK